MRAAIAPDSVSRDEAMERILAHPRMEGLDLTGAVTTDEPYEVPGGRHGALPRRRIRLRRQVQLAPVARRARLPRHRRTGRVRRPRRLVGAGSPTASSSRTAPATPTRWTTRSRRSAASPTAGTPVFGICLGHQLVARAFGGRTYKLLYGHRGGNHPVRRLADGAVEITTQNHGFAVRGGPGEEVEGAPALRVTHVNLNDGTIEGLEHREFPVFSVQYHPEGAPGPPRLGLPVRPVRGGNGPTRSQGLTWGEHGVKLRARSSSHSLRQQRPSRVSRRPNIVALGLAVVLVMTLAGIVLAVVLARRGDSGGLGLGGRIALLEFDGVLGDDREYLEQIRRLRENSSVKGYVLAINSPGGVVGPAQSLYRELKRLTRGGWAARRRLDRGHGRFRRLLRGARRRLDLRAARLDHRARSACCWRSPNASELLDGRRVRGGGQER